MHKYQQAIKWAVYTLLLINFGFYMLEDWTRATHTLTTASPLMDWVREFATSIDELGWFILIAMFELETYVLDDKKLKGWVSHTIRGARLLCYAMLAHTVYAYGMYVAQLYPTVPVPNVSSLCEIAETEVSFVYNLEYIDVTDETCNDLSTANQFFKIAHYPVVTDEVGLDLERDLAWVDLAEAIAWLLAVAAIELVVRLQSNGITSGAAIAIANRSKLILFSLIMGMGVWWAWLGHWLYLWDEVVWIGSFSVIGMNVNQWRDEIINDAAELDGVAI